MREAERTGRTTGTTGRHANRRYAGARGGEAVGKSPHSPTQPSPSCSITMVAPPRAVAHYAVFERIWPSLEPWSASSVIHAQRGHSWKALQALFRKALRCLPGSNCNLDEATAKSATNPSTINSLVFSTAPGKPSAVIPTGSSLRIAVSGVARRHCGKGHRDRQARRCRAPVWTDRHW